MKAEMPRGWSLPPDLARAWQSGLARATAERWVERLWAGDASLWSGGDEGRWLGWLGAAEREARDLGILERFGAETRAEGLCDALLLGMGGSSLAPEVLASIFGAARFSILDSTDPAQVAATARLAEPERALIIVASKSGSTLEPSVFFDYFWGRETQRSGAAAARRFVAITDPGSKLEAQARERGLRAVFYGEPSIGGRYSALSKFGLVPAAWMGLDLAALLARAAAMADACRRVGAGNPGLALGVLLGVAALGGRDKLTIVASPRFQELGSWLEQLLAESTGKNSRAILPLDGEALAAPDRYGADRLFVALDATPDQDVALAALAGDGQPVVRLEIGDPLDVAGEFFLWEVATAFAGAVLRIHPFDQPDVEASKVETRKLTDAYEQTGRLPEDRPFAVAGGLRFHADARNTAAFTGADDAAAILRAHLARLGPGDYAAFLAYIERNDAHHEPLQRIRHRVRDARRVATCVGFGPRFLHSTGQAYKGGPNSGVFLQITCDDAHDLSIPGRRATFGIVKAAQARGDFAVLAERGRRALRVHLGADVAAGLEELAGAVDDALA